MQYKNIFISCLVFSALSPLLVTAIDTTTSGRILDNFKESEYKILFETLPINQTGSEALLEHEYRMNGLEWLKNKLASMQQTYETKKSFVTEKRTSLEDAIESLDSAIEKTQSDITNSENSILEKQGKIQEYQSTSLQLKRRILKNRTIIFSYLANIHSEGSLIYDNNDSIDMFQGLILSDSSTDTIVADITYKSLVSQLGQKFVDEYKSLIKEYYRITLRNKEEIAELQDIQSILERQKTNLLNQKNEREKLLEITKWQEDLFQKYIDSQVQATLEVESAWQDASKAYSDSLEMILKKSGCDLHASWASISEKCSMMQAFYRNEHALRNIDVLTGTTNIMQWPVVSNRISTHFRDSSYFGTLGSQHDAIDIPVNQGSDVYAALDGYVYYILPPTEWGYSYLALRHPDGYVTVYGHLSEISVLPYQFVTKGQVIAKSGGAPGTPGAGPMTSGPHLHFEVWHRNEVIDPLRVLSLAPIDYENLPSKYQEKFLSDMVESFWTGTDLSGYEVKFSLKWTTEEDRQKYLLKTYATPDFQSWDMWIDTALENKVDPSFLMCVGLAETTLGNHLKTAYNIGNIGNTDSGSVYVFWSPSEGLDWMGRTFNNKFLSKYSRVSDLSRWGNEKWPIYASSNANWHNNIIRCLGALKWKYVEDDYNFRVTD